jgi:hypothetical protein
MKDEKSRLTVRLLSFASDKSFMNQIKAFVLFLFAASDHQTWFIRL